MAEASLGVIRVAEICHQLNKLYCEALGDYTQNNWTYAPDWQKQSAINGVLHHVRNPQASEEDSHKNWMKEKFAAGWRYGLVKDEEEQTHPCLVAFEELPLDQQVKDRLFKNTVNALSGLL